LLNTASIRRCSQCDSPLILVSRITEKMEGSKFPQTTSIYRCSNLTCQDEKDKEAVKRIKIQKDKEIAIEQRLAQKLIQKAQIKLRKS